MKAQRGTGLEGGGLRPLGRLIGAKLQSTDEGGGRFPTSFRVPLRKLRRRETTVKRRAQRRKIQRGLAT